MTKETNTPTDSAANAGAVPSDSNWLWRHKKSGGLYKLIGAAKLQSDTALVDMDNVEVYQGEDGRLWARNASEFKHRFERAEPIAHKADSSEPRAAAPLAAYPDADLSCGLSYNGIILCGSREAITDARRWLHSHTDVVPALRAELLEARAMLAAKPAGCSGDPTCCADNEGNGCGCDPLNRGGS